MQARVSRSTTGKRRCRRKRTVRSVEAHACRFEPLDPRLLLNGAFNFNPPIGAITLHVTDGSGFFADLDAGGDADADVLLDAYPRTTFPPPATNGDQFFSAFNVTALSIGTDPQQSLPNGVALVGVLSFLEVTEIRQIVNSGIPPNEDGAFTTQIGLSNSSRAHTTGGVDPDTGRDTIGRLFLFQADTDTIHPDAGVFGSSVVGGSPQDVDFATGLTDTGNTVSDMLSNSFMADLLPNFADPGMRLVATGSVVPPAGLDIDGTIDEVFIVLSSRIASGISAEGFFSTFDAVIDGGDWHALGLLAETTFEKDLVNYDGTVSEFASLGGDSTGDPSVFAAGWQISSEGQANFEVPEPANPAELSGLVWNDLDADGIQDPGEPGLPGQNVTLHDALGNPLKTKPTDRQGNYRFTDLVPGDYKVTVEPPAGTLFSPQDQGSADSMDSDVDPTNGMSGVVTLLPGEQGIQFDAGVFAAATIGDFVWEDLNNNGIQDDGEPGIAGVTVRLQDAGGSDLATTTTNGSGMYTFGDLSPGDYRVQVDLPDDFVAFTKANQGVDNTVDSNANPSGVTQVVTLQVGDANLTLDAGLLRPVSLGDFVWDDLNANGIQDAGEPGIESVAVELQDSGGTTLGTTTTNAEGLYSFAGLTPGDYKAIFTAPADFQFSPQDQGGDDTIDSDADTSTGMTGVVTLQSGESNSTLDAGLFQATSLGDFVWHDLNGDGIQDADEPGLAGVNVALQNPSGDTLDTTTTDADGLYEFGGLIPNDYKVSFTAPLGFVFTPPNQSSDDAVDSDADTTTGMTQVVTLQSGDAILILDAGLQGDGALGDFVWEDLNANGIVDMGEAGIAGVTVTLQNAGGATLDTTATNGTGMYTFEDLTPGDYKVTFSLPTGFQFTAANMGGDDTLDSDADPVSGMTAVVTLGASGENLTLDAGMFRAASLGDFVWDDLNADGIQDAGEPGIEGVAVELQDSGGTTLDTTTTDVSGQYLFSGLTPGDYRVQADLPAGFIAFTSANQGADDTVDSDVDGAGISPVVTLISNSQNRTLDAGLLQPVAMGDFVWHDLDADGVQDAGEPGLANVTVTLQDAGGGTVATTSTNGSGLYQFTNLMPSQYKITATPPPGFTISPTDQGLDTTDSDANPSNGMTPLVTLQSGEINITLDVGMFSTAALGNFVWEDLDANGVQDNDEPGLADVTVTLQSEAGATLDTTVTNADGFYEFGSLIPGNYKVMITTPGDFHLTAANQAANDTVDSDADPNTGMTPVVTLQSEQQNLTLDAGLFQTASLGDLVWEDLDANGVLDTGEPGIAGVTVTLQNATGDALDSTTTDADGMYTFGDLVPGQYKVTFTLPADFQFCAADQGSDDTIDSDANQSNGMTPVITLGSADGNISLDAGMFRPASVADFVWDDLNGNGIQDAGEFGVAGVSIDLVDGGSGSGGALVASTTSGADGLYTFGGLTPGEYLVQFAVPAGAQFTLANQGVDDTVDSDANADGVTDGFVLGSGHVNTTLDAGLLFFGQITGQKFEDVNGNGVKDDGEPGVAGFEIFIDTIGNNLLDDGEQSVITGDNGSYALTGLLPGTYTVVETQQDGWTPSTSTVQTIVLTSGQVESERDFGNFRPASISGQKFDDQNKNGIKDDNEPGLPGFTIFLDSVEINGELDPGEPFVITDAQGNYEFDNMTPAFYTVAEVQQDSYDQTTPPGDVYEITIESGQSIGDRDFGNHLLQPDLTIELDQVNLGAQFNVGDTANFVATVSNDGDNDADGDITVEFFLSKDDVIDETDRLLTTIVQTLTIGPDGSAVFDSGDVMISDDILPGTYHIITRASGDLAIDESTENNTDASDSTHLLALLFGTFGEFVNHELEFFDVRYNLTRGGFGMIVNVEFIADTNGDGLSDETPGLMLTNGTATAPVVDIVMQGTNKKSRATIKPGNGISHIGDVDIDGPISRMDYKNTDLHGDITIKNNAARIKLNHVHGPSHITIGNSKDKAKALSFYAQLVNDLSLHSGNEIKKFDVVNMTDTDGVRDVIQTRRIKRFVADEIVDGVDFLISRNLGKFTAAAMHHTNIRVGLDADAPTLSGSAGDIVNKLGKISKINLKGTSDGSSTFVDSFISCWVIKRANLGVVETDNSGSLFGLMANVIGRINRADADTLLPPADGQVADGDFVLQLVV